MIRIVLNTHGTAVPDTKGSDPGRGAYVCRRESCMKPLRQGRYLSRAFRKNGPVKLAPDLSFR